MAQVQFAQMVGLTQQSWNNYERGRRRIDLDQAFRLCAVTGVTLDWIYFGDRSGLPLRLAQMIPEEG
ncbi:helix-turn-helix transcriptional regulator [Chelatococcus asaccharovorans]|nr:hypothetical protein CHELA17_61302 [Chelatococcus asaccharovorans]CAH1676704.1 hypothetical protein CHELA40_14319 [Chelatococcus asaccharovorans]